MFRLLKANTVSTSEEFRMKKDLMEYDALIVVTPEDYLRVQKHYDRLEKLLPVRRVIYIGNERVGEYVKLGNLGDRVRFIDENSLISFDDVHMFIKKLLEISSNDELPRGITGWYYQQFLKMKYATICNDDYYMVWDGDTIPCKEFSMFNQDVNLPYLDLKTEYHEDYFVTLEKILPGVHKPIQKSFIAEHMLFRCDIMLRLMSDIEKNDSLGGVCFWEKILLAVGKEKINSNSFSEFETYGSYIAYKYLGSYRLRDWHSFRYGGEFFEIDKISDSDFEWLAKDFYAISFEKNNYVRDDHKNLFDNKEYQSKLSARQMLEIAQTEFGAECYREIWEKDNSILDVIQEANKYLKEAEYENMFNTIQKGLLISYNSYELYYLLAYYYYLYRGNSNQAYLCFENALFFCNNEQDRQIISDEIGELKGSNSVEVRKTAIIIVSYNNKYMMQKNIECIRNNLYEDSYVIIVVDNASEDGVTEWLCEQDDIYLIRNNENLGFPKACNQGAKFAFDLGNGKYDIYLLNNDTRLAPNSLFWLRMGLYEDDNIGATGSISNYAGNNQQIEIEFSLPTHYLDYGTKINIPQVNWYEERIRLSGFSMLVRGNVWNTLGGMDELFSPGYFEDDDLCVRIFKAGYKMLLCKNSFIYHAGSQSFSVRKDVEEILTRNHKKFVEKYGFDILQYTFPEPEIVSLILE